MHRPQCLCVSPEWPHEQTSPSQCSQSSPGVLKQPLLAIL
uniref:Uncharacterized protein n=1 Tax=Anguilla anguilla TaxID=7936 RepID=A0A0E9SAK7_ANGAN